jgi:hypothetical protein
MIDKIVGNGIVFWQEPPDEPGEPAIILRKFQEVLELKQAGAEIFININTIMEFIKAIRLAVKG